MVLQEESAGVLIESRDRESGAPHTPISTTIQLPSFYIKATLFYYFRKKGKKEEPELQEDDRFRQCKEEEADMK